LEWGGIGAMPFLFIGKERKCLELTQLTATKRERELQRISLFIRERFNALLLSSKGKRYLNRFELI
jgi:hypothetical protein